MDLLHFALGIAGFLLVLCVAGMAADYFDRRDARRDALRRNAAWRLGR